MTETPAISVVVPTRGRTDLVEKLLISLRDARKNVPLPTEVIIVDGSPPDQATIINCLSVKYGGYFLRCEGNVSESRNKGAFYAKYPIVLFVDSDCVVTDGLFSAHVRGYTSDDIAGVVGVTEFAGPNTMTWKALAQSQFLNAFSFARRMDYCLWGTSSNISFRKKVFEEVGGFDESFPFALGGEDFDIGLRVSALGYKLKSCPEATVYHTKETWNRPLRVVERCWRWGRVDYYLFFKKHSNRLRFTFPKQLALFLPLFLAALVEKAMLARMDLLMFAAAWLTTSIFMEAALLMYLSRAKLIDYGHYIGAIILGLIFECGTILESLSHGDLRVLCMSGDRGPVLPMFRERKWKIQRWATLVSLVLALFLFLPRR